MHHLAAAGGGGTPIGGIVLLAVAVVVYWVPTAVAWRRHVPAKGQVLVVNLFLGWTFIGWVVALVMAFRHVPDQPAATGSAGG